MEIKVVKTDNGKKYRFVNTRELGCTGCAGDGHPEICGLYNCEEPGILVSEPDTDQQTEMYKLLERMCIEIQKLQKEVAALKEPKLPVIQIPGLPYATFAVVPSTLGNCMAEKGETCYFKLTNTCNEESRKHCSKAILRLTI